MPTNYLSRLDKKSLTRIKLIGRRADEFNLRAFLVGGIVRDLILGRKNFDLDIVVEGDAMFLCQKLERKLKGRARFYKQFGTATLDLRAGGRIDFASARQESYPEPGSLPVVKSANLNEDLFRRDFTVNSMAIAINHDQWGTLADPWGGLEDLRKEQIRIMHLQSFLDDPTRILRAIRFEQRFGFRLEHETVDLIKKALAGSAYQTVKPPRLFAEFKKILQEKEPLKILKRLNDLQAMQFLSDEPTVGLELASKIERNVKSLKSLKSRIHLWLVYCIAVMDGLSKEQKMHSAQKFPFTKEEKDSILQSLGATSILKLLASARNQASDVFKLLRPLALEVVLLLYIKAKESLVKKRLRDYLERTSGIELFISGNDLKKMGFESNKYMGEVLERILSKKINREIHWKAQELSLAQEFLKSVKS